MSVTRLETAVATFKGIEFTLPVAVFYDAAWQAALLVSTHPISLLSRVRYFCERAMLASMPPGIF